MSMLDRPTQIEAFVLLQVYYKLRLEVRDPTGPKWRVSPMKQANAILDSYKIERKRSRTKKTVLAQYEAFLDMIGVLQITE